MKYILTAFLILLMQTIASAQFLQANRVQDKAFSLYQKDGATVAVEITLADYFELSMPGTGAPLRSKEVADSSWKWIASYQRYIFDTPTGELEPGYISDAWKGNYTFVGLDGNLVGISTANVTGIYPDITTIDPVMVDGKIITIDGGDVLETPILGDPVIGQ